MNKMTTTKNIFYAVSFSLIVGMGLNSCFVDGSGDTTFFPLNTPPGQVKLPIYKAGDSLEYSFGGERTTDFINFKNVSGKMLVEWTAVAQLTSPIDTADQRAVLEETSTITFDDGTGNAKSVRFISQDTTGNMFLHAVNGGLLSNSPTDHELFWVNSASTVPSVTRSNIFVSPVLEVVSSIPKTIKYDILKGCTSSLSCTNNLTKVTEEYKFIGRNTNGVSTIYGKFETVLVNYTLNFSYTPQVNPDNITTQDIDTRALCGNNIPIYSGERQIHPDIGIVYMFVSCLSSDVSYKLYFELSGYGGSIVIPEGT